MGGCKTLHFGASWSEARAWALPWGEAGPLGVLKMAASIRWLCVLLLAPAAALATEGLVLPSDPATWPRWHTRLSAADGADPAVLPRVALLGDYDLGSFGLALPGALGRFRATGGVFFGPRGQATAASGLNLSSGVDGSTVPSTPYLGLGYTGWLPKTGFSFSADIGFMADTTAGNWRFGRALFGNQGADASLREMRLQPRLQLGVQYTY